MTVIHTDELRDMTPAERANELDQLQTELLNERAVMAAGGAPENPGRIKELRKAVARAKTIQREEGDDTEETSEFVGDVEASDADEDAQEFEADDEADDTEADADDASSDDETGDDAGEEQ